MGLLVSSLKGPLFWCKSLI